MAGTADPLAPDARRSREDRAALIAKLEAWRLQAALGFVTDLSLGEIDAVLTELRDGPAETPAPQEELKRLTHEDVLTLYNLLREDDETIRVQHARKQGAADGFQQGWHAALKRIREGDAIAELTELVPVSHPAGAEEPTP